MEGNISLFDLVEENGSPLQIVNPKASCNRLDVVKLKFDEALTMTWQELFEGFDKLYAITYSSGIGFACELIRKFSYVEVIFGCDEVISYTLQEVMAYQIKTIERIRDKASKTKIDLISRIDEGKLKLFIARRQISHEKIYLLEATDGRKRVVMGSANMSYTAFSGNQRENICYVDGNSAFDWYKESFERLKEGSSDDISVKALEMADDGENLEEIPVMQTVKIKKALVIEPANELKEDVRFVLDIKKLSGKFAPFMPKADKKGKIMLSPENVKMTRRHIEDAAVKEKELRSEYPQLLINIEENSVKLNDKELDLHPSPENIKNDVSLFLEYMDGYKMFHGDVDGMQTRYFEFANWFFVSPFMAPLRNIAVKYNQTLLPYPVFGLVYGQSKAGKTSFLETLLKMMIGQKTKISAPDFTRSSIEGLKRNIQGAPIIVDDLTQSRFSQHAIETIKNDEFGVVDDILSYPAVVISANEDVKAVAPEITRRTVICRVQAGLTNTELMKSSVVRKVQQNIGTAFYREYLCRMMELVPSILDGLKGDDMEEAPDILAVSSKILCKELITEPACFRQLFFQLKQLFRKNFDIIVCKFSIPVIVFRLSILH